MKKYLYNFVKDYFRKIGYTLNSDSYININQPLNFTCDKGHRHKISFSALRRGQRCAKCLHDSLKTPYSVVKEELEKEGYTLLSGTYINSRTDLYFICPNNHKSQISFSSWRSGHRCRVCSGNVKNTVEYIEKCFNIEGYTLLSKEYKNQKQKLNFRCPFGHEHQITWTDWKTGYRCRTCFAIKISGPGNYNWCGGEKEYCDIWKDKEYKEDIKKRDNNMCSNPYCSGEGVNARQLTIHHIDYNKKNCSPTNLITVCRSCNTRANYDRDWHKDWYMAILNKKK